MSLDANKAIVRRFWQGVFNEGNIEIADELFAPEHVTHHPYLSEERRGPAPMKGFVSISHKVVPNLEAVVEDEIAEGDKVVTRWTARGKVADNLQGGEVDDEVAVSGISVFRVSDGKIEETWFRFEADLDESEQPVPKEEFREWLLEDTGTIEARFPQDPDTFARFCCLWRRGCCHEPQPPFVP